jgi:hypothetical protein
VGRESLGIRSFNRDTVALRAGDKEKTQQVDEEEGKD